jgi:hypothetical protein
LCAPSPTPTPKPPSPCVPRERSLRGRANLDPFTGLRLRTLSIYSLSLSYGEREWRGVPWQCDRLIVMDKNAPHTRGSIPRRDSSDVSQHSGVSRQQSTHRLRTVTYSTQISVRTHSPPPSQSHSGLGRAVDIFDLVSCGSTRLEHRSSKVMSNSV